MTLIRTRLSRTARVYEHKDGVWDYLIVDQSPGKQRIFYKRLHGPRNGEYECFEIFVPWTRTMVKFQNRSDADTYGYGRRSQVYMGFDHEPWNPNDGLPTVRLAPFPCLMSSMRFCGLTFTDPKDTDLEGRGTALINDAWTSSFRDHITQSTWGNPFWDSFEVEPPQSSYIPDTDTQVLEVFKRWSKSKLREIVAKDLGESMPFLNSQWSSRDYYKPADWKPKVSPTEPASSDVVKVGEMGTG